MAVDPNELDQETLRFLYGLRKRFREYGRREEVPGFYAHHPFDLIVIDAQFLREIGLLKPDIVVMVALHELYHALHPKRRSEKEAWDWSHKMILLLRRRGYFSPRFKP